MKEAISVTKLNRYIKDMFTQNQMLYNVMVKGEISNFKVSHGNYYFSLKDEGSSIQAIIFANSSYNINIKKLHDGMNAIVTGRVAVYDKAGTYAIYVSKLKENGLGDYFIKLNELKEKLSKEGLFDDSHKKEIPKYSMNIGVVTAENGAAIKDIIKTIKNKNPYARIVLYPAKVQGDDAYESIVRGIKGLDKEKLDTIIIGRGGGSIEDLYAFNDERVAYAIFEAKTPIISAVGHEINESISDFVADLKVATPTAAGEAATFSYDKFLESISEYKQVLKDILNDKLSYIKDKLEVSSRQIDLLSPSNKLKSYKDNIIIRKERLHNTVEKNLYITKAKLKEYIEMLKGRNALDKLEKGFAYVTDIKDKRLTSVKKIKIGSKVKIKLVDGTVESNVNKIY